MRTYKFSKSTIVDKFLIIIMLLLFFFNALTVFVEPPLNAHNEAIDIIMHTMSASIFGYFLSSNFANNTERYSNNNNEIINENVIKYSITNNNKTNATKENMITNKIGFSNEYISDFANTLEFKKTLGAININTDASKETNVKTDFQIYIISFMSIFSIVFLFFVRYSDISSLNSMLLSQFRDIICGGIGFLIGVPFIQTSNK